MTEAQVLREAMLAAPLETSNFGETPEPQTLYLPPSHLKALRLEAHVVVGSRGVGKSFWTAALQCRSLRDLMGTSELVGMEVRAGFANAEAVDRYPNADVFSAFLGEGGDPYEQQRSRSVASPSSRSAV